eukprot:5269421-Prymnesium_polylepis.2
MHQWRDLKEPDLPEPSDPPISEGRPAKSTSDDRKSAPEASVERRAARGATTKGHETRPTKSRTWSK